jgi:hypothetical protein
MSDIAPQIQADIDDLLKIKRSVSESEYDPSIPTLNAIIERLLSTLNHVELPTKQPDAQLLDLLLMESVMRKPLLAHLENDKRLP